LGIAYAGSAREDISEMLSSSVGDSSVSIEIASLAALALGFVFVGSGNGEVAGTILQAMMEREDKDLNEKWAKFMGLGLALLFLGASEGLCDMSVSESFRYTGKQDEAEITAETLKAIEHPIAQQTLVLLDALSYAGTGNVLKIQAMLHHCNDHLNVPPKDDDDSEDSSTSKDTPATPANADGTAGDATAAGGADGAQPNGTTEEEKKDGPVPDTHQAFAVLGLALIAMGEDVGSQMSLRSLNHLVCSL
jgi:26S proteasome regulatory subunit N1